MIAGQVVQSDPEIMPGEPVFGNRRARARFSSIL